MKNGRWLAFAILIFVFTLLNTLPAYAAPSRTTYQAKIVKPDGYPLESSNVNFKFTILEPAGCSLYAETFSGVNMGSSLGLVSFSLGSGVRVFPVSGSTFEQVFSNTTASLACEIAGVPSTYSPLANDIRRIVMQFNDGSGWQTLPAMVINAVPYAMYANDSIKFSGKDVTDFVQVASLPTCGASQAMSFNGASFSCITAGGSAGGSVTSGSVTTALGYTPADNATLNITNSTVASVSSAVFSVSSTVSSLSNSVSTLAASTAASFSAITSSQWVTSGSAIVYNSGNVVVSGGLQISMDSASCTVALAGTLRYNSGVVEYCNGTNWSAFGVSGSGILALNGISSGSQTFATGTAGNLPNISSTGSVHTFNIPFASTATTTAGTISYADYLSFSNKQSATSAALTATLGYTPADTVNVATSMTSITNNISAVSSAVNALANAVTAINSSQWSNSGSGSVSGTVAVAAAYSPVGPSGTQNSVPTSGGVDDGFYTLNLPFAVGFNGTSFSTVYIGTNSYVTFGGGTTQYSGLTAANPNLNKIMVESADRSSNSVWFFSDATSFSVRYEGGCTTAPAASLVWELSGNIADASKLKLQIVSLCGSGLSGVFDTANLLASFSAVAGSAYSIELGSSASTGGIAYLSGNVGIGTSAPTHLLHVSSASSTGIAVNAETNANSYLDFFEATVKKANIYLRGADDTLQINDVGLTNTIINRAGGNVGIGTAAPSTKLDVSGGIRLSMEAAGCVAGYAGTIRYNSGIMQFCDGSTWLSFATGNLTSATVVSALGYTPANVTNLTSVSSTVNSLSTTVATSFTSITNSFTAVSSTVAALSTAVGSIKSSQWSDLAGGSLFSTTLTQTSYAPLGQLGTQNSVPSSGSADDGFYTLTLPFAVSFNGTSYTTIYVGTNSYATFGAGTALYSSLSVSNPNLNKIMINSADRSSNSVWFFSDPSTFSIRYEGGCGTAPGNALVWELQGSSANPTQLKLQIISVCSGGFSTLANTTTQLQALNATASTAYLIDYAVSSDSIFYTGNVGVGTSAPIARLDVVHGPESTYGVRVKSTTSATAGGLFIENDIGDNALIQVGKSSASATLAGHMLLQSGSKDMILNTNSVERLRILSTGNVGVGTLTPVTKLDVAGGIRLSMESASCAVSYAGTLRYNTGSIEFCNGTSWAALGGGGAVTSATVATALGSSTQVGIGTNSPSSTLDVSGTIRISGGSPGAGKVLTSDASGNATWGVVSGDNLGNHTATQNINLGTNKLVGNGGSEGITIDALGNVRLGPIGGNVGLTMGPAASTAGSGWGSIAAGFNSTASSITTYAFGSYVQATNWYAFATGNNNTAAGKSSAVFGENMRVNGDNSIGFGLSNSVSYTVTNANTMAIMGGKVGIGTTTPATTLEVSGSLLTSSDIVNHDPGDFRSSLSLTHGGTGTGYGNGATVVQVFENLEIVNFEAGYVMMKTQDTERMRITSTGRVGIGVAAPATNLHVRGGASYGAIMIGDNGGIHNHHLTHEIDGSFNIFNGTFGSGVRQFSIASAGAVTVSSMIRSDSAATDTNLARIPQANEIVLETAGNGTTSSWLWREKWAASNYGIFHDNSTDYVHFVGNNTPRLSVGLSNSYVGVGTSAPTANLHVNGTTRIVDGNQAAGRVLASDASGNANWKQTIIHGTIASNSATSDGTVRVGTGVSITLPPGRWLISGMGITVPTVSCRADFGIRDSGTNTIIKYTLMPAPTNDYTTASVSAYVDIASTTTYDLYIISRGPCTSQVHSDNNLWELTATGVAY